MEQSFTWAPAGFFPGDGMHIPPIPSLHLPPVPLPFLSGPSPWIQLGDLRDRCELLQRVRPPNAMTNLNLKERFW